MFGETFECDLDDHVATKRHISPNEIIHHVDGRHFPEQLCVRGSLVSYMVISSRCMDRLPNVVLTTM